MAENQQNGSPSLNMLSVLDGLWKFDKLMKLVYYILFFDAFLVWRKGFGVFKLSASKISEFSIGDLVAFLIVFGFFSSFFLVILNLIFHLSFNSIRYSRFFDNDDELHTHHRDGYVSLYSLRKHSLEHQSDFAYKIYKEESDKRQERLKSMSMTESVSVGCLFIFICGWYLSRADGATGMIIDWLSQYPNSDMSHAGVGFLFSMLLFFYCVMAFNIGNYERLNAKVYYPPLYAIEKKERDKRRELERQWEQEYQAVRMGLNRDRQE